MSKSNTNPTLIESLSTVLSSLSYCCILFLRKETRPSWEEDDNIIDIKLKEPSASKLSSNLANLAANLMNTWPKNGEEATPRLGSFDVADFSNTIYDFFTGDQTGVNFITNIGLQVPFLFAAFWQHPIKI